MLKYYLFDHKNKAKTKDITRNKTNSCGVFFFLHLA